MSKQINLESNNPCSSLEDYRAVYMYQENRYKLSQNTSAHCSSSRQDNFTRQSSCETEVEISSTVDDPSVNSESKSCNDSKTSLKVVPESSVYEKKKAKSPKKKVITDIKIGNITKIKKRQSVDCDDSCDSSRSATSSKCNDNNMSDVALNKDSAIRDSHVSTTQETPESLEEDNSTAETNETIPNLLQLEQVNVQMKKPIVSKRGRPRKHLVSDTVTKPSNPADEVVIQFDPEKIKKYKKRGRPKKVQTEEVKTPICSDSEIKAKEVKENFLLECRASIVVPSENLNTNLSLQTEKDKKLVHKVHSPQKRTNTQVKNNISEESICPQEVVACPGNKLLEHNQDSHENVDESKIKEINEEQAANECDFKKVLHVSKEKCDEDETDDISLSKLKETLETSDKNELYNTVPISLQKGSIILDKEGKDHSKLNENSTKRHSRMPHMSDFEYNIDSIVSDSAVNLKNDEEKINVVNDEQTTSCIAESSSGGRSLRRKGKKILHYDESSDEDPFANVELSDDDGEPRRSKKGKRYFSDDEYIPGKKHSRASTSDTADSDIDKTEDDLKKTKRKKVVNKSPKKKGKKYDADVLRRPSYKSLNESSCIGEDDFKFCSENSVIKIDDDNVSDITKSMDTSDEFESFLAKKIQGTNLKIKRVTNVEPRAITPLEIPILDHTMINKTVEIASQTNITKTKSTSVQTTTSYDIPMKTNVPLSVEQAKKACTFLKDIVQSTSELGELMTQKSEDFIKKKINTTHVTDTFKMDYCVKKSFLLFKLAKHNLMQMEEDLSKQYETFLKESNLMQYREEPKSIIPTSMISDNDSDCEIIEESLDSGTERVQSKAKPSFNLKTVFLNKELSIKIAKKPSEEQNVKDKINIEGKNRVWISDSVLVKKVKPTQSFLEQDSRNKKPPDIYVTNEMVSDFFQEYYRQTVSSICAPFISTEWQNYKQNPICCNYFYVETIQCSDSVSRNFQSEGSNNIDLNGPSRELIDEQTYTNINGRNSYPKSLFALCIQAIQNINVSVSEITNEQTNTDINGWNSYPKSLFALCIQAVQNINASGPEIINEQSNITINGRTTCPRTLFSLCVQTMQNINASGSEIISEKSNTMINGRNSYPKNLISLCVEAVQNINTSYPEKINEQSNTIKNGRNSYPKNLFSLCVQSLQNVKASGPEIINEQSNTKINCRKPYPKNLFSLCVEAVQNINALGHKIVNEHSKTKLNGSNSHQKTLFSQCVEAVQNINASSNPEIINEQSNTTINGRTSCPKTLFSLCVEAMQDIKASGPEIINEQSNTTINDRTSCPKTLFSLCVQAVQNIKTSGPEIINEQSNTTINSRKPYPKNLFSLCDEAVQNINASSPEIINEQSNTTVDGRTTCPKTLFSLCVQAVQNINALGHKIINEHSKTKLNGSNSHQKTLFSQYVEAVQNINASSDPEIINEQSNTTINARISCPKTLFSLCVQAVQNIKASGPEIINEQSNTTINGRISCPKTLFSLCVQAVQNIKASGHKIINEHSSTKLNESISYPKTLFSQCVEAVQNINASSDPEIIEEQSYTKIYGRNSYPSTLFSLCVQAMHKDMYQMINNKSDYEIDYCIKDDADSIQVKNHERYGNQEKLSQLCLRNIRLMLTGHNKHTTDLTFKQNYTLDTKTVYSLKSLCYYKIVQETFPPTILMDNNEYQNKANNKLSHEVETLVSLCYSTIQCGQITNNNNAKKHRSIIFKKNTPNSLKQIAYSTLIEHYYMRNYTNKSLIDDNVADVDDLSNNNNKGKISKSTQLPEVQYIENKTINESVNVSTDVPLCSLKLKTVKTLYEICLKTIFFIFNAYWRDKIECNIQINSVTTVPEEVFVNLQNGASGSHDDIDNIDDEESSYYTDDLVENDCGEDCHQEKSYHQSNVINEFKPIVIKTVSNSNLKEVITTNTKNDLLELGQVKLELIDNDITFHDENTFIKPELTDNFEETNFMPQIENIAIAKEEKSLHSSAITSTEKINDSYLSDSIEELLCQQNIPENRSDVSDASDTELKVFGQCSLRVRKHFEPDSDHETDDTMSLLVPQTYESFDIDKSVDVENINLEEKISNKKKTLIKTKPEKRKAKPKLTLKKDNNTKEEMALANELALFAEKLHDDMTEGQEKIRDRNTDCDSDDNIKLKLRSHGRLKKDVAKQPTVEHKSLTNEEIQCNDVDSTQQITENKEMCSINDSTEIDLPGTNHGLMEYNDFVNTLYSKIKDSNNFTDLEKDSLNMSNISGCVENFDEWDRPYSPVVRFNEHTELVQCEPTMPLLSNDTDEGCDKIEHDAELKFESMECNSFNNGYINKETPLSSEKLCKWKCYPIDIKDTKLYQQAIVVLDRLPDTLIESYLKFHNLSIKGTDNNEIKRLKNLQSLDQREIESTFDYTDADKTVETDSVVHPFNPDRKALTSINDSEIKQENVVMESNVKTEVQEDMQSDQSIKQETEDMETKIPKTVLHNRSCIKEKLETSSSTETLNNNPEVLMLTADKMMSKELQLLYSQPGVNDDTPHINNIITTPNTSTKNPKIACKNDDNKNARHKEDVEDNSSSEEEKQWVNTKEKLLKKLEKTQEDLSLEEAKRAKIVSEFLEKHDGPEMPRRNLARRGTRSRRSILEEQKQLSVLTGPELFGESSGEAVMAGKKGSQTFGKGRRNIRKVIDKKSLARSTVLANKEEFERKKRLVARRAQWKELLGSEDVLVVDGEVCLEYDFNVGRPIVSIHPYFTSTMKAHQYDGVKFMWDACFESLELVRAGHPGGGCILAHCMGLGKTLQVLALLHTVLTHPHVGMQRVLVCCPLSTVLNWVDEIHKWIGPVTNNIKVFELSKLKKTYQRAYQLEDWYNGGGIFIIGYELFRNLSTLDPKLDGLRPTIVAKIRAALLDPGPDIIVCDEGHLLKNDSSVLAVAMSRVATKRRIVLTGTPMQNNLREYYCMVNFVKPNLLGRYSEYANRFENPIMNGQHRDSREEDIKLMKARTHILHKVLEGCLQRQEASVLYPYLPKKHEYTVFIPLTKCQSDLYKHYLAHCTRLGKHSVLRDFHVLQKIWTHPQVLHLFQVKSRPSDENAKVKAEKLEDDLAREDLTASEDCKPDSTEVWWLQYLEGGDMLQSLESSNKLLAVFRILDECTALDDKVLIFSTSLFSMDTLEYFLKRINGWSLGKEYYRLDGSVPPEVRQKWCREFNSPNNTTTKLFLISTRAGCLGLNMTAANRVIILDTSWNPAHDVQSIFRVYRFGQKKDCYIYRLVALGTMEQKIYERAVTKQAVACRVIDEQQIDRHYNMDELTELYKFDETGAGVAGGVAVGVTDVALLRVARDAPLHAVHEHDSLLRGSAEQQLPEHERAAAWQQFEREQASRQLKNLGGRNRSPTFTMPVKRLHGHDYAKSPIKPPDTNESAVNDSTIDEKVTLRTRRERKCTLKYRVDFDEEPCTSAQAAIQSPNTNDVDKERLVVEKIKAILIQHNFQNKHGAAEISALVNSVREVITAGLKGSPSESSNVLTASIAKALIDSKTISTQSAGSISERFAQEPKREPTPDTESQDEVDDAQNKIQHETDIISVDKNVNLKRKAEGEDVPPVTEDSATGAKRMRRAALNARKKFSLIDSALPVNIDDDDEEWTLEDNNSTQPLRLNKSENKARPENAANGKLSSCDNTAASGEQTKAVTTVHVRPAVAEESILLSDDDDVIIWDGEPEQAAASKEDEEPKRAATSEEDDVRKRAAASEEEDERVPLHESVLKSPSFIKIVAHTYQSQNPALEDGAAQLAAAYATQNVLKAIQAGNAVYDGPIYDLAMKIITKDVLKKLHNSTSKMTENLKMNQNEDIDKTPNKPSTSQTKVDSEPSEIDKLKTSGTEKHLNASFIEKGVSERTQKTEDSLTHGRQNSQTNEVLNSRSLEKEIAGLEESQISRTRQLKTYQPQTPEKHDSRTQQSQTSKTQLVNTYRAQKREHSPAKEEQISQTQEKQYSWSRAIQNSQSQHVENSLTENVKILRTKEEEKPQTQKSEISQMQQVKIYQGKKSQYPPTQEGQNSRPQVKQYSRSRAIQNPRSLLVESFGEQEMQHSRSQETQISRAQDGQTSRTQETQISRAQDGQSRTQERQNSSDSDDLVLIVDPAGNEPPTKIKDRGSMEDSKSRRIKDNVSKVYFPVKHKSAPNAISTTNAPAPVQKSAPVKIVICGGQKACPFKEEPPRREGGPEKDDGDDVVQVMVVDPPMPAVSSIPKLKRRHSRHMAVNRVLATDVLVSHRPPTHPADTSIQIILDPITTASVSQVPPVEEPLVISDIDPIIAPPSEGANVLQSTDAPGSDAICIDSDEEEPLQMQEMPMSQSPETPQAGKPPSHALTESLEDVGLNEAASTSAQNLEDTAAGQSDRTPDIPIDIDDLYGDHPKNLNPPKLSTDDGTFIEVDDEADFVIDEHPPDASANATPIVTAAVHANAPKCVKILQVVNFLNAKKAAANTNKAVDNTNKAVANTNKVVANTKKAVADLHGKGKRKMTATSSTEDPVQILHEFTRTQTDNLDTTDETQTLQPAPAKEGNIWTNTSAKKIVSNQILPIRKQINSTRPAPLTLLLKKIKQIRSLNTKTNPTLKPLSEAKKLALTKVDTGSSGSTRKIVSVKRDSGSKGKSPLVAKSDATKSSSAIVGSAKEIMISRRVDTTPPMSSTVDLTNIYTNCEAPIKANVGQTSDCKKRTIKSTNLGSAKKPKTGSNKLLTLKDFNLDDIDDIDDIIELD